MRKMPIIIEANRVAIVHQRGLSGRKQPKRGVPEEYLGDLAPQKESEMPGIVDATGGQLVSKNYGIFAEKSLVRPENCIIEGAPPNEKSSPHIPLLPRLRRLLPSHGFGSLHVAAAAIKPATVQVRF